MPRKGEKHHGERDSPFFRLKARAKLAKLLHANRIKLESLARDGGLYHQFEKPKASGGVRLISAPFASAVPKMRVNGRGEDVIFFDGVFFKSSLKSIFFVS